MPTDLLNNHSPLPQESDASHVLSADEWIIQGETAFASGDYINAKLCFEKALQRDALHPRAYNNLSVLYWQQGDVEEALTSLTKALELDPDDRVITLNCTDIFLQLGKADDAKEILQAYLNRRPWDDEVKSALENMEAEVISDQSFAIAGMFNDQGEQQFQQNKLDNARTCFELALEQNPNSAKAHSNLGVIRWKEGRLEEALEHFHKALALDPQDLDILYNSSQALAAAGQFDAATDLLKLYLQQRPQDEIVWQDYNAFLQKKILPDQNSSPSVG